MFNSNDKQKVIRNNFFYKVNDSKIINISSIASVEAHKSYRTFNTYVDEPIKCVTIKMNTNYKNMDHGNITICDDNLSDYQKAIDFFGVSSN